MLRPSFVRVECWTQACIPFSADGSKRGTAKTLKTNYVIAPPPPPPPRRMLLVRNNVVVSVGKPGTARTNANRLGFTLLTYNLLAEIYVSTAARTTPQLPLHSLPHLGYICTCYLRLPLNTSRTTCNPDCLC